MTIEEYKQLMSDYGFSVVEYDQSLENLCVAFFDDYSSWRNTFAIYNPNNGEVISCLKLYFEKSQGICVVCDYRIRTKDINELRPIVIDIAEQYKNLLVIQKKEEIKKDFV